MATSNLGSLDSVPKSKNNSTLTTGDPTDVYKFNIDSSRSINLSLNEISAGDDADLYLYRDSNRNGRLDNSEKNNPLQSSTDSFNNDDAINFRANAGTYFAEVRRYAGSSGSVTYDLDLSATRQEAPDPERRPSNLLPVEVNIIRPPVNDGDVEHAGFTGSVGNSNTADVYAFSIEPGQVMNIDLYAEVDGNAHFRLIEDFNGNHIVDSGEVSLNSSDPEVGTSLGYFDTPGNYLLQVYQKVGSTNYELGLGFYNANT